MAQHNHVSPRDSSTLARGRWPGALKGHLVVDIIIDHSDHGLVLDCGYVYFLGESVTSASNTDLWAPERFKSWLESEAREAQARLDDLTKLRAIEALGFLEKDH